nr:MAG TPA: hypothetical protein [Caudoviricetes sp.]
MVNLGVARLYLEVSITTNSLSLMVVPLGREIVNTAS